MLEAIVEEMADMFDIQADGPPSLLDSRGMTIERVRAFADAAAAFYGATHGVIWPTPTSFRSSLPNRLAEWLALSC